MIELSRKIIDLIENARKFVVKTTNTTMIFAYYSVGKMIVDELQSGSEKAEYGTQLLVYFNKEVPHLSIEKYTTQSLTERG